MSEELMAFNGINGASGDYLLPEMTPTQFAQVVIGQPQDKQLVKELQNFLSKRDETHAGVVEGVDPLDLAQAGWGVIFPFGIAPEIVEALRPLTEWRCEQAASKDETLYREYIGPEAFRPDETKRMFLARHDVDVSGPANPKKMPYYLMLVGGPDAIPYSFQYQLDVQYGVGRIAFDTAEEYHRYALSVVEAEKRRLALPRRADFFGVANPDDRATNLSAEYLINPLASSLSQDVAKIGWELKTHLKEDATKSRLAGMLGGPETPALFFSASHGMGFPRSDARQVPHQGALLCQDWPGPNGWRGKPIPQDFYFSGDDLSSDANLFGLMAFFFACYGAGTPQNNEFAMQLFQGDLGRISQAQIAEKPFLASLPQRMLAHPKGGALAVVGHIERAWGYSFYWGKQRPQLTVFESALRGLMKGYPIGYALEYFNSRYAEFSTEVSGQIEDILYGKKYDPVDLSSLWTANNDARNYVVLGDPAVRLAVAEAGAQPQERPAIIEITSQPVASTTVVAAASDGAGNVVAAAVASPGTSAPGPVFAEAGGNVEMGIFGDAIKGAGANINEGLGQFLQKLGQFLSNALDDATSLEVRTYVSDNLAEVKYANGEFTGARLRALTRVKVDGDTLICVPEIDGVVDTELWKIHTEMMVQAQASRSELLKTVVSAATGLGGLLKP